MAVDVKSYELEEIKEYHFHIYFFQSNEESTKSAKELRQKIIKLIEVEFFHPVATPSFNMAPRGPHLIGSFLIWCPKEHFARLFSWLVLNRGQHTVLIHPLTREEFRDHTERAVWMGQPLPIDTSQTVEMLPETPAEYVELGMGYSAPSGR